MSYRRIITCRHCGEDFDLNDPAKVRAGGFINECVHCIEERGGDDSPPKYLAIASGNGKMSDISILKFADEGSREQFKKNWDHNSGRRRGKSCQLNRALSPTGGIRFETVAINAANDNHKGRS